MAVALLPRGTLACTPTSGLCFLVALVRREKPLAELGLFRRFCLLPSLMGDLARRDAPRVSSATEQLSNSRLRHVYRLDAGVWSCCWLQPYIPESMQRLLITVMTLLRPF